MLRFTQYHKIRLLIITIQLWSGQEKTTSRMLVDGKDYCGSRKAATRGDQEIGVLTLGPGRGEASLEVA